MLDSFDRDPWGGISLDELTVLRYQQYRDALADDRAFQRPWLVPVRIERQRGEPLVVAADQGIHDSTEEALAKLAPLQPDGVVSFGTQTHPADGTAAMIVTDETRARYLSGGEGVARILSTGFARVERGRMPKAPVPAARQALEDAGARHRRRRRGQDPQPLHRERRVVRPGDGRRRHGHEPTGCAAGDTGAAVVVEVETT